MSSPRERLARLATGVRHRYLRSRPRIRNRRPERHRRPVVRVIGPDWFIGLFEPEFIITGDDRDADLVLLSVDTDTMSAIDPADVPDAAAAARRAAAAPMHTVESTPFIQSRTMNPRDHDLVLDADLPADIAALATAAQRQVDPTKPSGRSDQRATEAWLQATAAAHRAYRHAHHHSVTEVVAGALRTHGLDHLVPSDEVTVICATRRPHQLDNVINNYTRQTHPRRRLIVVTNSAAFDLAEVMDRLSEIGGASVIEMHEDVSLGLCLNAALDMTTSRYVAKFDDDDRYGAHYLSDMMIAHRFAAAAVVGKHSHYAVFSNDGRGYLRFASREFCDVSWVAGGTLVIDRERTGALGFEDRSIGEDGAFLSACLRRGHAVYAADRFNYVQYRSDDNTWAQSREVYLRDAIEVTSSDPLDEIEC